MKFFQILFFIIFSYSVVADDITDFELEGLSIGGSAIEYFAEEEILNGVEYFYKKDEYKHFELISPKLSKYDSMHLYFKKNDKNYIIQGLDGTKYFINNISDCYKELIDVDLLISSNFNYKSRDEAEYNHPIDDTGNSTVKEIFYEFNFGIIQLTCVDYSKKMRYYDHLRVSIQTEELDEFIYNDYYN